MFANAMDSYCAQPILNCGENGTLQYTAAGVGDSRVALFFALVRNIPTDRLINLIDQVIETANSSPSAEETAAVLADLFVLTFQTRDCRGGKGEKAIFDTMILHLYNIFPNAVLPLLCFIPKYGCYKDMFRLLDTLTTIPSTSTDHISKKPRKQNRNRSRAPEIFTHETLTAKSVKVTNPGPIVSRLVSILARRLQLDLAKLNAWEEAATSEFRAQAQISLCAKYAPREGKALAKGSWMSSFHLALFPVVESSTNATHSNSTRKALYRKLISRLTAALDVPEVKMSGKRYREIEFSKVPSVCTNKFRKAFLNELTDFQAKKQALETLHLISHSRSIERASAPIKATETSGGDDVRGYRYPEDQDRVQCRNNFRAAILSKGVHGKQMQPHQLVVDCLKRSSAIELDLYNAQWGKIREDVIKSLADKEPQPGAIDFRKLVPMVDVSGSMSGDPMHAAIALGILTSEINHPLFRNRFITFDTNPTWVDLSSATTLAKKVEVSKNAPWGGSTDIDKAFDLILAVVEINSLPMEEVPDLIIFSDMQFNLACGNQGSTQLERIEKKFAAIGQRISGKPYAVPRIVFWNLRGDTHGYPAQADTPNVQMLSGFSPSLLKLALTGETLSSEEEATEPLSNEEESTVGENDRPVKVKAAINPYDTFRRMIDDERYDTIRVALDAITNGPLAAFHYKPPPSTINRDLATTFGADAETNVSEGCSIGGIAAGVRSMSTTASFVADLEEGWELVNDTMS